MRDGSPIDAKSDLPVAIRAAVVPVGIACAAPGVNTFSTHVWPLLLSMVQLVLAMWPGFRRVGGRAGLLASALLDFLPLDVNQAAHLMPDGLMATLLTAAAAFRIIGRERVEGHDRLLMFLSGMCLTLTAVTNVLHRARRAPPRDVITRTRTARDLLWPC